MNISEHEPSAPATDRGYWREYRLGPFTEAAHVAGSTVIACAIGLAGSFGAILLIGLLGEEGLIPELSEAVDQVSRSSLGYVMLFGYLCGVVWVLAHSMRAVGVSRALVRAADDGADPMAVPHPVQVEQVVVTPHLPLLVLLVIHAALAAIVLPVMIVERETVIAVCLTVLVSVCVVGSVAIVKLARPAHRLRRARIAEHWTAHAEETAWGHSRKATRSGKPTTLTFVEGDTRSRRGLTLLLTGSVLGVLSVTVLEVFLFVRYPGSVATPGATLQDRGRYSAFGETVLDGALWVTAGLGLVGLATTSVGVLLVAAARAGQRADLIARLESGTSPRPEEALLSRFAERTTSDVGQICAGLGAFVLAPAFGILRLATHESDTFLDSVELFAGVRTHALVGTIAGVVLIVAGLVMNTIAVLRDYDLRDRLQQRWPTLPKPPDDKDDPRYKTRTRPTLRRTDL